MSINLKTYCALAAITKARVEIVLTKIPDTDDCAEAVKSYFKSVKTITILLNIIKPHTDVPATIVKRLLTELYYVLKSDDNYIAKMIKEWDMPNWMENVEHATELGRISEGQYLIAANSLKEVSELLDEIIDKEEGVFQYEIITT